jgi:hypothetical protein
MSDCKRLSREFYTRDVLKVAPALLSKILVIAKPDGTFSRFLVQKQKPTEDRRTWPVMPAEEELREQK